MAAAGASASASTSLAALGGSSEHSAKLRRLTSELADLLREQAEVSKEANRLLTAGGGLNESTRRSVKSVEAAIAKSRQPGYFKYFEASDEMREVEAKRVVAGKVAQVTELQARIDAKQAELDAARKDAAKPPPVPDVPDLRRWFDRYQRPDPTFGGDGASSTFKPSARVFGGTRHYPAFRSVATDMTVGRMLR